MPDSPLHRIIVCLTGVSARHRRAVLTGWVLYVVASVLAGGIALHAAITVAADQSWRRRSAAEPRALTDVGV